MRRWQRIGLILLMLIVFGVDALCETDDSSVKKVLENPKYYGFVDPMQSSEMMLQEAMSLDADLDVSPNYEYWLRADKGDVVFAQVTGTRVLELKKTEKESSLRLLKGGGEISAVIVVTRPFTIREMLNIFESGVNILSNHFYSYLMHGDVDAVRDIAQKENVRQVDIYNSKYKVGHGLTKSPWKDMYTIGGFKIDMKIVEKDLSELGVKILTRRYIGERFTEFTLIVSGEYENVQTLLELPWVYAVFPPSPADELMELGLDPESGGSTLPVQ